MYFAEFFLTTMIYLGAAVIAVPLAKRFGLGSVLGYLIAGIAIGPFAFHLVDPKTNESVLHFTEFGVVMMLFLIGLELRPSTLWQMRGPILGLGGLQVLATGALLAAVLLGFGNSLRCALALGAISALSSTAIVLSTLGEKGWMRTEGGQASFSVLLFQDIAVIPMIALLPLLADPALLHAAASGGLAAEGHGAAASGKELSGAWQALAVFGAIAGIILAGRFAFRPIFRIIARTHQHEIFTAAVLLLVVGISMLMTVVGLSPALGAFLAGVVLAESEFRHEIESDIEPFKGLLLGIFFISVGSGIDFSLFASHSGRITVGVIGLMSLKMAVLWILSRYYIQDRMQRLLFFLGLAQGGEFAFVLFAYAKASHVLAPDIAALGTVVVAITMLLTPFLFILYEQVIRRKIDSSGADATTADEDIEPQGSVLILGFGRFGHVIGRILQSQGFGCTVLDQDSEQIEFLSKFGFRVFYGDASRVDLMRKAGAEEARLIVVAIDDENALNRIIENARRHFPEVPVAARALSRAHAYELMKMGVTILQRDTFASAVDLSIDCLKQLGMRSHKAHRIGRRFKHYDESVLRELAPFWGDEAYFAKARAHIQALEEILSKDSEQRRGSLDSAWDPPGQSRQN